MWCDAALPNTGMNNHHAGFSLPFLKEDYHDEG